MLIFSIIIFILVIAAVTYVFLVMPRVTDAADMDLQSTDYAHRGLHNKSVPENSLTAFRRARDAGYGIELDVRLSQDGRIFVFHDENLMRMCGVKYKLSDCKSSYLRTLNLKESWESIPTLKSVLELIDGNVPILIEIKGTRLDRRTKVLCKRLSEMLDSYHGAFAVQSFSPEILSYFRKYRPRFARGLLLTSLKGERGKKAVDNAFLRFALRHMLTNVLCRPDFISVDGTLINEPAFLLATKLFRAKGFVWTVRTEKQYSYCRSRGLYTIFERIDPK